MSAQTGSLGHSSLMGDTLRHLMRSEGLDTLAIAQRIGCSEADIYNQLARATELTRSPAAMPAAFESPPLGVSSLDFGGGFGSRHLSTAAVGGLGHAEAHALNFDPGQEAKRLPVTVLHRVAAPGG